MRGAVSLAYLLARISDTLADTTTISLDERLQALVIFREAVAEEMDCPSWPSSILNAAVDPRERRLLEHSGEIFKKLQGLPKGEAGLVREVLEVIVSGQMLDLQHFASATLERPVALRDDSELEDYTWRVAGSVGAFWTKLGFLTMGDRFSSAGESTLIAQGTAYGKGLQLVNILRDVSVDLAMGRCYLPVLNPQDSRAMLVSHAQWLSVAEEWISEGENYARTLQSRRLRAATLLPAMIARQTLEQLRGVSWEALQTRIKVSRSFVYRSLIRAFL
jgi:farnesyl-diphosphate farnesyltransferase